MGNGCQLKFDVIKMPPFPSPYSVLAEQVEHFSKSQLQCCQASSLKFSLNLVLSSNLPKKYRSFDSFRIVFCTNTPFKGVAHCIQCLRTQEHVFHILYPNFYSNCVFCVFCLKTPCFMFYALVCSAGVWAVYGENILHLRRLRRKTVIYQGPFIL